MAAEYSPDRVTFLFVDYKGGSAFADCVELPHCVGLVTDLSPHLVRRALTSLRAELHHREHLFNRKKAKDLLELEKRRDPETPPALVLVIDEFAALASEVPEFVDGVVDIAQRGRSLGIHLIMATQRPAGVIKDNLRANTNLRVALRMADESDSRDVVGDPIAALFDPSIPGRGIAKTGPGRLVAVPVRVRGRMDAPTRSCRPRSGSRSCASARPVVWERDAAPESTRTTRTSGPTTRSAWSARSWPRPSTRGIPAPRRPWLDELPTTVDIAALPARGDGEILLGLARHPRAAAAGADVLRARPRRRDARLRHERLGQVHAAAHHRASRPDCVPTSGRRRCTASTSASGALRSLESLPHVGSVISGDDAERVQRLLRTLGDLLDRRGRAFSEANAASLTEYRRITGLREPRIILLIDGFGQFKAEWDATTVRMPFYHVFMRILGEGRPLGVHVVATADRAGAVPTAVSANVSRRIVLRLSDGIRVPGARRAEGRARRAVRARARARRGVRDAARRARRHLERGRAVHGAVRAARAGSAPPEPRRRRRSAPCRRRTSPTPSPTRRRAFPCSASPTTRSRRSGSSPSARSS